jgi:hypothetical protein
VDFTSRLDQISLFSNTGAVASKKQCKESEDKSRREEGGNPPFSNSLQLHFPFKKNGEKKQKQLAEGPEDRRHIARGRPEVGSSCRLQGIKNAEQQVLK